MLAVNGKVSGYCVQLPVCNLQTVKSFANHLCLWNAIFPVKMPPVHEVWSWSLWGQGVILTTGQPCLSLNPSPHSLHPVQLFGRLSWLKKRLKQAKWKQIAHETEPSWRLPDHPDGVGPSHHPSLQCPHTEAHPSWMGHLPKIVTGEVVYYILSGTPRAPQKWGLVRSESWIFRRKSPFIDLWKNAKPNLAADKLFGLWVKFWPI